MAKSLDNVLAKLPAKRRSGIQNRAAELATLKDLRQAMYRTQKDLAAALNIGQDSVSRLEKRSDMLLSTLREYIEAMGGRLEIVAQFPNRPPYTLNISRKPQILRPQGERPGPGKGVVNPSRT